MAEDFKVENTADTPAATFTQEQVNKANEILETQKYLE